MKYLEILDLKINNYKLMDDVVKKIDDFTTLKYILMQLISIDWEKIWEDALN